MSEAATSSKVTPMGQAKPLQVLVAGKVTRVRRHEKFFYTTILPREG